MKYNRIAPLIVSAAILIICCDCGEVSVAPTQREFDRPFLDIKSNPVDLGTFEYGNAYHSAEFQFENSGVGNLEISNIRTSCGCVVASIDTRILAPGAKANVRLTLDGSKLGEQSTQLVVCSNFEQSPEFQIEINWRTVYDIMPIPASSSVNFLSPGLEKIVDIRLQIREGADAGEIKANLDFEATDAIAVSLDRVGPFKYQLKARAFDVPSSHQQMGSIEFTSTTLGKFKFPFGFTVETEIVVSPSNLWLTLDEGAFRGELLIRSQSNKSLGEVNVYIDQQQEVQLGYKSIIEKDNLKILEVAFDPNLPLPIELFVVVDAVTKSISLHK